MTDNLESEKVWRNWLKTRPENVQTFARRYPYKPGTTFEVDGRTMFFIGYGEYQDGQVGLLITPIDPRVDYHGAVAARQQICPDHFSLG